MRARAVVVSRHDWQHASLAGNRRPQPLPIPPPLGGIVLDGSNVIATSRARADARLDLAVAWFRRWRPDLPICVYLDHATVGACTEPAQQRLRRRLEAEGDAAAAPLRYRLGPRDAAADPFVLRQAHAERALIVSNDRFFDRPELRAGVVTVQFECTGERFEPYPEATWFTPTGGAVRVAMATLQAARSVP